VKSDGPIVVRHPVGPPPLVLRLAAVLVVPLLLYALVATGQKALENYRLNQEADALRTEIQVLRSQNVDLQHQIEDARADSAIESLAREQLGLIKPGDHPLVMVDQPSAPVAQPAQPAQTAPQPTPPPTPVWQQWWAYLFG
jgi:cell division protein FtsL